MRATPATANIEAMLSARQRRRVERRTVRSILALLTGHIKSALGGEPRRLMMREPI
jgi:hypothetical protein